MTNAAHLLLLLHGALGSSHQFSKLTPLLTEFSATAIDFEGHGGSPGPEYFTLEGFKKNVLDWIDKEVDGSVDIFGYSMGGYVALFTALHHPERVGRIITLGTKFDWTPESAAKELRMLDPEKIEAKVPQFVEHLQRTHHPEDWKTILRKTGHFMQDLGNGACLKSEDLGRINIPVFIGLGDQDEMVGSKETQWAVSALQNAKLTVLKDTRHPIEKTEPEMMAAWITECLNR